MALGPGVILCVAVAALTLVLIRPIQANCGKDAGRTVRTNHGQDSVSRTVACRISNHHRIDHRWVDAGRRCNAHGGKAAPNADPIIPVNVGDKLGIFKKHGLDLTIVDFTGGSKMTQAMVAGSIDIGVGAAPRWRSLPRVHP